MAKKPVTENELYKAAPLLHILEGKEYHPEENVLKMIEEVATLREAVVYSTKGSLKFTGEIDGEELVIEVNLTDLHRSCSVDQKVVVKATVGSDVQTFSDSVCTLYIGFSHFMDLVKCMAPFKKGHVIPKEYNLPLEYWAETDEGKKFFENMAEIGFHNDRKDEYGCSENKYWYDSPFSSSSAVEVIPFLEYSESIDHFINPNTYRKVQIRSKSGNPAPLFYFDSDSPFVTYAKKYKIKMPKEFISEWDYDHPKHPYGVCAADFLDMVKKIVQHNNNRIEAISKEHGGLTWRGIQFSEGHDKFEKPLDYRKLPEAERKRIDERLDKSKADIEVSYDTFFSNSVYKKIYQFFKERGTVKRTNSYQFGDSHDISFSCNIVLETPKKDRTLTKKTVEIHGYIQGYYVDEIGSKHGDEICIVLPFHYATDKGSFPSWSEAVAAGSNIRYGGSLNVGATKSAYELTEGKHYGYSASRFTAQDLKRIEKILLNIEADNQKFLKDCHYKD